LATSSMISLSSSLVSSFSASANKCPSFPQVLMNVIDCFSITAKWEMLPCKYDVLQFYCHIHF
jgi:hypothetical protein